MVHKIAFPFLLQTSKITEMINSISVPKFTMIYVRCCCEVGEVGGDEGERGGR